MKMQIAAIEFGTSKIVTVIAQNSGTDRLNIIGSGTVPYNGYSNGDWNTPGQMIQRVRDSIAAAELQANTKIKEIYVGVPGEYIHVRSCETEVDLPDGTVDEMAMNAVQDAAADLLDLRAEGGLIMHRTPSWFIIDDGKKTMNPKGKGTRLRAMTSFVIADPQFVDDIREMMGALDITILGFLSPTQGESLLLTAPNDRDQGALLIDVGYLNTEISVIEGDAIIYHAILPQGGGHIAADLATELRISMRAAEQIKRNFVFNPDEFDRDSFSEVYDETGSRVTFPREMVGDIVQRSFDELVNMIDMTIRNDADQFLTKRSQVFLTGGGIALMRGAKDILAAAISRPIRIATAKSSKMNGPTFAAALGLADLIFNSIEYNGVEDDKSGGKFMNIFGKKN